MAKDRKPSVRIDIRDTGITRVDVKAAAEGRRKAAERRARAPACEDDRVAQTWDRTERRERAAVEAAAEIGAVKARHDLVSGKLDLAGRDYRDSQRADQAKRTGRKPVDPKEQTGTAERIAMSDVLEISSNRTVKVTQSPMDVLRARSLLSKRQSEAGLRLLNDWFTAGLSPVSSMDYGRTGGGGAQSAPGYMPVAEMQAAARQRFRDAIQAMGKHMSGFVLAVVISAEEVGEKLEAIARRMTGRENAKQATAALIEVLKVGLKMLADHYRLPDDGESSDPDAEPPVKVRSVRFAKATVLEENWDIAK
ncbi:DUF6456 domain-containing protein [Roseixanthobacter pseudopolyaromaticivorans]|uniref:DUF6456 domain-containing protein n=1 Tax=Xanthobacteraceae TaxID=335928 RepID=UPI00372B403A